MDTQALHWRDSGMAELIRLELSCEEMEMIQVSVAERLKVWETTMDFLNGNEVGDLVEDCHKSEEVDWMIERYRELIKQLDSQEMKR